MARIYSTYQEAVFKRFILSKIFFPVLLLINLLLFYSAVSGQSTCTAIVKAGNDTSLCAPAIIRLHGSTTGSSPNIRSILWQPPTGLSNPAILSPTANISSTITYLLTVTSVSDSNMILNGNFNAGATGFTTSYIPGTGGTFGLLSNTGTYAVNTNPNNVHINFATFGDHTTGNGNMMIINGDSTGNVNLWCETFQVNPNTDYVFSAWVASCVPSNPAILQFLVNGIQLGANFTASLSTGIWTQFSNIWNSGINTTATICILNQNTVVSGNDFALDDISLRQTCIQSDSVTITLFSPGTIQLGPDTTLCQGESKILDATSTNANSYLWNTGDTTSSISVNSTGTYSAIATINGTCPVSDTIQVVVKDYPQVTLGSDTIICQGASLQLNASSPLATSYQWNNGSTRPTLTVTSTGQYWVEVANGRCISVDTIQATQVILPVFSLGNDTSVCIPDSVVLSVPAFPGYNYTWFDGSHFSQQSITSAGTYWLQMDDSGCTAKEYLTISSGDCGIIFIPNSFSPNGDTKNDTWSVFPFSVNTIKAQVFDRWGELLFSSDKLDFSWDGNYGGRYVEQGVYNYLVTGIYISGNTYEFRGTLVVIR